MIIERAARLDFPHLADRKFLRTRGPVSYLISLACLSAAAVLSGCSDSDKDRAQFVQHRTAVEDLPKSVIDSATAALPGVEFTEVWENTDRQTKELHSYEIRGRIRATGKIREVRVDPSGKILEME